MSAPWIRFAECEAPGVTKRWEVVTTRNETVIGRIFWSTGWRRYVLTPAYPTDWDESCLRTVADFIESQTRAHKGQPAIEAGSAMKTLVAENARLRADNAHLREEKKVIWAQLNGAEA